MTKDNLLRVVADLVDMLREYGVEYETLTQTLLYHGFTKKQIEEWYGVYFEK
jgi:hypothetical protein